jgi:hypothetical protein
MFKRTYSFTQDIFWALLRQTTVPAASWGQYATKFIPEYVALSNIPYKRLIYFWTPKNEVIQAGHRMLNALRQDPKTYVTFDLQHRL